VESWLLIAAVVALVALTGWLVSQPPAARVGHRQEEVIPMTADPRPERAPADDAHFEDRYTSATADLSAGGIATGGITSPPLGGITEPSTEAVETLEELDEPAAEPNPQRAAASATPSAPGVLVPLRGEAMPADTASRDVDERGLIPGGPVVGVGAGSLVVLGAASGAWLYYRWQQERNKPINRLRRRVRSLAQEVESQVRDGDLAKPAGASSLLVASVLLGRAFLGRRGAKDDDERPAEPDEDDNGATLDRIRSRWGRLPGPSADTTRALTEGGAALLGAARERVGSAPRPPAPLGLGIGGLAVVAATGYVVWRVLNRPANGPETWHMDVPAGA